MVVGGPGDEIALVLRVIVHQNVLLDCILSK